jgi:Ca2+-binding EF-hand superfamily protein
LDTDRDGEITLKEFVNNFRDKFSVQITELEMAKIIRKIDVNGDRAISFTEFVIAACNKATLL